MFKILAAAIVLSTTLSVPAQAAQIEWTFSNAIFNTGGAITGALVGDTTTDYVFSNTIVKTPGGGHFGPVLDYSLRTASSNGIGRIILSHGPRR